MAALALWQNALPAVADAQPTPPWLGVLLRLLGALALGTVVALLFRRARARDDRQTGFDQTLVLLAPLIAMVTMAVGSNIAAAFTLVGTLAIVRFRTAIRDSRDTAFVIFSVATGLAMGSGSPMVAGLGTVVVGGAILAISLIPTPTAARHPADLRLLLSPVDADVTAAVRVIQAMGGRVTVTRTAADRKQGTLDVRLHLHGVEAGRFTELLGRLLELPEVGRATCVASEDGVDGDPDRAPGDT